MNIPCIRCKGADLSCGRSFCPIIAKAESMFKVSSKPIKEDFFGSSPAPFVGRYGYPEINVGIMTPPEQREDAWLFDAPKHWANSDFKIAEIIDLRSALINSRFKANIKGQSKLLDISQEVGMASKPVDLEINLKDKPHFRLRTDAYLAPQGPNAQLEKARITENPKIDTRVDKVVSDIHLKANDALKYLYEKEFDENFLAKMLSVGVLGIKNNRKLVPTRWSIVATDDIIGKSLISEIKDFSETDSYYSFFGNYLGNYYLILMFPEVWSYELFETYAPPNWDYGRELRHTTDYESYSGRKLYASNTVGGYYTVRLAILEKLKEMKRQASVLALRFITDEYTMPLGVWVTRESARKTVSSKPIEFSSKELMLDYARKLIKRKFNYNIDYLLSSSILLKNIKQQTKLVKFI